MITAIDPGTTESAMIKFDGSKVTYAIFWPNEDILQMARENRIFTPEVAIEDIESFGMPVGKETFGTVRFIGRLQEALERHDIKTRLIGRKSIKLHLCGSTRAKDPNVRQALLDKYGAVGTKKAPGPLHGVSGHLWSALAIADYALTQP